MNRKVLPVLKTAEDAEFGLGGETGRRLTAVTEQWLFVAPVSNPAMLEMFRDRDRKPLRDMVPWAGEFAGKYLTHAVQIYRLTGDERLKKHLDWFVRELTSLQAEDGYLGPWPADCHLTGKAPNAGKASNGYNPTWDAWGHYHVMLGLLLWHGLTGDRKALACARRMGDLFCTTFLDGGKHLVETGSEEMNLAPIHS
ncbi:MAG: glycoside hydrolase family 127 protein, partial [Candidatus Latescibacteria bacterium]|nr:glycoside hydrolase family 127 protein [Candidatus Latescibacterota bacterium]